MLKKAKEQDQVFKELCFLDMLRRFKQLTPSSQKRLFQLVDLYEIAKDQKEADEIGEVLREILFPDPADLKATKLA